MERLAPEALDDRTTHRKRVGLAEKLGLVSDLDFATRCVQDPGLTKNPLVGYHQGTARSVCHEAYKYLMEKRPLGLLFKGVLGANQGRILRLTTCERA